MHGGIEDYADSMATHYLMDEPIPKVPVGGTDPDFIIGHRTDKEGKKSSPIVFGRRSTWGKASPEYTTPTDVGAQKGMIHKRGPIGQYHYTDESRELGKRPVSTDLVHPDRSNQPIQGFVKVLKREKEEASLAVRRANATPFVGETPNVHKPLSREKRANIPLSLENPNDELAIKQRLAEYDRPRLLIERTTLDKHVTPADIRAEETKPKGSKAKGVVERVLSPVRAEERTQSRGINPRTGQFFSDEEIGNLEWKQLQHEAWSWLRSAPGTPEKTTGLQRGGAAVTGKGTIVSLTGKSSSGLTDLPASSGRAVPQHGEQKQGRSTVELPSLHPTPSRRRGETRSAVMPGYDPHGEKGYYEGHEEFQRQVAERLKSMSPAESIHAGMLIEQMAKQAGRGDLAAIDRSIQAGQQLNTSMGRSRQMAQDAHTQRIRQIHDMQQVMAAKGAILRTRQTPTDNEEEVTEIGKNQTTSIIGKIAPNKDKRVSRQWKRTTPNSE